MIKDKIIIICNYNEVARAMFLHNVIELATHFDKQRPLSKIESEEQFIRENPGMKPTNNISREPQELALAYGSMIKKGKRVITTMKGEESIKAMSRFLRVNYGSDVEIYSFIKRVR